MATLPQRFKLLATRCAAGAPSPSRSPAPSFRPAGGGLRSLLMRRSWRPVLVAIPESEGKIELGAIEE
ncbi:unnamed protein product [Triticum turgidum subsp. durum]|uniref:Uncharacterized protein n=2 Tax=Triticum TaxID=4564 RepID=A0A9R1S6X5_TRITD|nr:unnamed protein product [Triticum aestivum]VAH82728.1 unnamed protein product [Triticum turgidum subsp. durum]